VRARRTRKRVSPVVVMMMLVVVVRAVFHQRDPRPVRAVCPGAGSDRPFQIANSAG
jgi:hypothetical protein